VALMMRVTVFLLLFLVILIIGGGGFLAMWDIPAPSSTIEKTLPDDRFPR